MPFARRSTNGLAVPAPAALPPDRSAPAAARRVTRAARIPAPPPEPAPGPAHPPARLPLHPHRHLLRAAAANSFVPRSSTQNRAAPFYGGGPSAPPFSP